MQTVRHGAHIRPYEICKQLGIPLAYPTNSYSISPNLAKAIMKGEVLVLFPGYTADQVSLLLTYLAKFRNCKLLLDVADIPFLQYKFFQGEPSSKSINDFARLVHISDTLLFSTRSLEVQTAKIFDISRKNKYVVENASDPIRFKFTPLPSENVILFVGGYIPARGVDELIQAVRILRVRGRDCTLKLAGFGYPESLAGDGVEVIQNVYYDQIPSIFASSYLFVIPHRPNLYMRIAAPIKLFDAMASGRPIVSTSCEETVAIIESEGCGIESDPDPSSIAENIEYLLENREVAQEMGRKGRSAIEQRHSWKMRADQVRQIIEGN